MRHGLPRAFVVLAAGLVSWCAATGAHAQPATAPPQSPPPPPPRPNVVLILADDLGYSDLGCYGGEIRTPHLDALARGGLRFTQFYNNARCCPTRASLMTGLYPHQAGVGRMTTDANLPGYRGALTANTVTIAEVLRAAGYRTGMVGKWHLCKTVEGPDHMKHLCNQEIADTFSDPATYPVGRGFDFYYGTIWGVMNFFDPFSLVRGAEAVREVPKDYYATDAFTDEAVKFIEGGEPGQPFFLYLAPTAPHWPLHAREEDVARYAGTYDAGWDAIRVARHRRMVEMKLLPGDRPTLSAPIRREARWAENPTRAWDARAMAVHAAMVDRMDQGVGRVVAALRKAGTLDDTLILFLSDNGASPEAYPNPGFDRPR
jgi:arylsulfatase